MTAMKKPIFIGHASALITPFRQGEIDFDAYKNIIEFQLAGGVDAFVINGTTGEPATMTDAEWEKTLAYAVSVIHGRVPVIAGTGGNNTVSVIEKAKKACALGAAAQLCVTPYYNKTTQEGLIAHYTKIADETDLPIIVYNVPGRTGLNLKPATLEKIASHPHVAAVKEASGDLIQVMDMMNLCGDQIDFYAGSDELTAPMMALGAKGVISVVSNIAPALMTKMTHGAMDEAMKINLELLPLIHALFAETSPAPVKTAAAMMGLCQNEVRLPLVPVTDQTRETLKKEMQKIGLIKTC